MVVSRLESNLPLFEELYCLLRRLGPALKKSRTDGGSFLWSAHMLPIDVGSSMEEHIFFHARYHFDCRGCIDKVGLCLDKPFPRLFVRLLDFFLQFFHLHGCCASLYSPRALTFPGV
ncbi:MAG: hypothetical protein A4E57_04317 [Syntrophorhabdaceae bacterium PtaU1.Bin034]|nr:MAG: hypothetical protein A4E57_04317 [Syntrophorhabdaceae bacterium PtaU1.Bin034]